MLNIWTTYTITAQLPLYNKQGMWSVWALLLNQNVMLYHHFPEIKFLLFCYFVFSFNQTEIERNFKRHFDVDNYVWFFSKHNQMTNSAGNYFQKKAKVFCYIYPEWAFLKLEVIFINFRLLIKYKMKKSKPSINTVYCLYSVEIT